MRCRLIRHAGHETHLVALTVTRNRVDEGEFIGSSDEPTLMLEPGVFSRHISCFPSAQLAESAYACRLQWWLAHGFSAATVDAHQQIEAIAPSGDSVAIDLPSLSGEQLDALKASLTPIFGVWGRSGAVSCRQSTHTLSFRVQGRDFSVVNSDQEHDEHHGVQVIQTGHPTILLGVNDLERFVLRLVCAVLAQQVSGVSIEALDDARNRRSTAHMGRSILGLCQENQRELVLRMSHLGLFGSKTEAPSPQYEVADVLS